MKVYRLTTMPASSEDYYNPNVLVKYVGTTTQDFTKGLYYVATYDDSTGIYGWEEAEQYNTKVFTRENIIYLLNELTERLQVNHIGE